MQIARDAETLGLLFKALTHYRCPSVADLAQRLGVAHGPPLLEAVGIDDDVPARWAEVAGLVGALWHRSEWPEVATDVGGSAVASPPPETPADAGRPAPAPPAHETRRGPPTALRALCDTVGLSVQQLAAKVGVPVGTIGSWERGEATPEARQVGQLAQALGVTPEEARAALHAPGDAG